MSESTINDNRPKSLKTKLHTYNFEVRGNPQADADYHKLFRELQTTPGRGSFMNCIASRAEYGARQDPAVFDIELDTAHVFSNQWNTVDGNGPWDGHRVFDWYEPIFENRSIHAGHYLEITQEMIDFRRTLHVCGYCGKNKYGMEFAGQFCGECFGSEYLKETELHLTRLLPVCDTWDTTRKPLTAEELATIMPRYIEAQTRASGTRETVRKTKARRSVEEKYQKEKQANEEEHNGMVWLLDHDINIENCIYYSHTRMFSFGWRQPVSESVKSALLDVLTEFPFAYEIKTTEGKVSTR